MSISFILLAFILFFLIATLYSSVGHAGASGYLAIMALLSFAPDEIKPTSLILNCIVASIASYKFIKAGCFDKRIFIIFLIGAFPMAFIGGYLTISPRYFKLFTGLFLIISAFVLIFKEYIKPQHAKPKRIPTIWGISLGGIIGFLSGLIGVGGGIFLSPIIIMSNWTAVRNVTGISALFILFNSISGLAGHITALKTINGDILYWILAVILGGITGSYLGTKKFNSRLIIAFLFVVLLSAGVKFIVVDFM